MDKNEIIKEICFIPEDSSHISDDGFIIKSIDDTNSRKIKICDSTLLVKSDLNCEWAEINPWLNVTDSTKGYWDNVEIEDKIDIIDNLENVLLFFSQLPNILSNFEFSDIYVSNGDEKFRKISDENCSFFYTILEEKRNLDNKAIKIKYGGDKYKIARETSIFEYSKLSEQKLIDKFGISENFKTTEYPTISKIKYRFIVVDNFCIFGISLSESIIKEYDISSKIEIEVEFWSKLMPKNSLIDLSINQIELLVSDITKEICKKLIEFNIKFKYPGERKYDWFNRLFD